MFPSSTFCLIPGLCFSFASSESKRIHSIAMAKGVTTALKTAEERLNSLSWETSPPNTDTMRWGTSYIHVIEENDCQVQQSSSLLPWCFVHFLSLDLVQFWPSLCYTTMKLYSQERGTLSWECTCGVVWQRKCQNEANPWPCTWILEHLINRNILGTWFNCSVSIAKQKIWHGWGPSNITKYQHLYLLLRGYWALHVHVATKLVLFILQICPIIMLFKDMVDTVDARSHPLCFILRF